uniref:Core domain-containing protein n=1 Tax=viral metagenome TaxID=1070528 RepID=A0A6C0F792_9ZZZZ|tara:strand:+ start:2464 stop:2838 length:375 start_codon:yes stop_codon:yes gene_type:complete
MTSIRITQNAWSKIRDIITKSKNEYGFVYSTSSGGCNGFNFELDLLEKELYDKIVKNKYHTVMEDNGTKVYVDPMSEMFLLGTTIDYVLEDYSKGQYESKFNFEINKDIMTSCGCGISFSPKGI